MSGNTSEAVVRQSDSRLPNQTTTELRRQIDRLIREGEAQTASRLLSELWVQENTASTASFLVSRFEQLRPKVDFLRYRLAILRSFTVEPIVPLLRAATFSAGIELAVHTSDFNSYVQEIVDPESPLYSFAPDAVVLAVQCRDVAPELWRDFADLSSDQVKTVVARVISDFRSWVGSFRARSNAHLIIHNLEQPPDLAGGIFDHETATSQSAAIQQVNRQLRVAATECRGGLYILDYDALVARHGRALWHDERKWLTVRLPIATQNLSHVAKEWLRFLHPLTGKIAKACVVDLDNTLWGGNIGEDGINGIKLGTEYPGAAFRDLQRVLLDLHRRGILLAVCSKNNHDDAMDALQNHPGMLLRPNHFAAMRINWTDKAQNLREVASELNIGVDALAFLDDNPIERQQVQIQLPEVHVIDLPHDPMQFAHIVRECPVFERLAISDEDQQRGAMYQAQSEREQVEQSLPSREDFYRSLQQEAEIGPATKATLTRIAQLTNRTNQFNLTSRRYTEQQILEMISAPGCHCFCIRLRDRFGDNGLVGVAITRQQGEACEIDTFLLSCRVIGRTVETAFLSFLADHSRKQGARRIQGWFLPTKKNAPARGFYANNGFSILEKNENGTLWGLDLSAPLLTCPEWVKLRVVNGESA
jgi:FkbH-like protein